MLRRLSLLSVSLVIWANAAAEASFPNPNALVIDTCPHIELTSFRFSNKTDFGKDRYHESAAWRNVSNQAIVSFQIKVVRFDPFDRRMGTNTWTVNGNNSTDWSPLQPGTSSGDGILGASSEDVFTAIAYVNAIRFADGSIWWADEQVVKEKLGKVEPQARTKTNSAAPIPR